MRIDLTTGLLQQAKFIVSPNYNNRSNSDDINLLVIHGISLPAGEFGGDAVIQLFTNTLDTTDSQFADLQDLQVSAHLWIRRSGEVIQFVPFQYRAWHAGISSFQGRENCNDFSIGIELEGTDTLPYAEIQYQQLIAIIKTLRKVYPAITTDRIVGHADIAPGRKTDPGSAFDWHIVKEGLELA